MTQKPSSVPGAVGERPACPICGAPVKVTAMTYGFPKLKFSGGAVGEREEPSLDVEAMTEALMERGFLIDGENPDRAEVRDWATSLIRDYEYARLSVNEGGVAPVEPQEPR